MIRFLLRRMGKISEGTTKKNFLMAYVFSCIIMVFLFAGITLADKKSDMIMVDRFSGDKGKDGQPLGWELEKKAGSADISIDKEGENYVLHLVSEESSFGVKKKLEFQIQDYPFLHWSWKVAQLPVGGDVRVKESDDQAAQVYIAFPKFPAMTNTRLIGYIWENEAPKDSVVTSPQWSKLKYIVLRDKTDKLSNWIRERRNVYEDYKMLFEEEPPKVGGVSLYINSQHTKSVAESYFDDIYFSKE